MTENGEPTRDDLRLALGRMKWWEPMLGVLAVASVEIAQRRLVVDIGEMERLFWFLFPIVSSMVALWFVVRRTRRQPELEREIAREAATWTVAATLLGLLALAQVEEAFGLPPSGWRFRDIWFAPLLFYVVASVLIMKRYSHR